MRSGQPERDDPRRHVAHQRYPQPEPHDRRQLQDAARLERRFEYALLQQSLKRLDDTHCNLAPPLHARQIAHAHTTVAQWPPQHIRRLHRILDGHVDPNATNRRHRVRRIANAQQACPIPLSEPVCAHCQELDLVPVLDLNDALGEFGHTLPNGATKGFQPRRLDLLESADHVRHLPVRPAIDQREEAAR